MFIRTSLRTWRHLRLLCTFLQRARRPTQNTLSRRDVDLLKTPLRVLVSIFVEIELYALSLSLCFISHVVLFFVFCALLHVSRATRVSTSVLPRSIAIVFLSIKPFFAVSLGICGTQFHVENLFCLRSLTASDTDGYSSIEDALDEFAIFIRRFQRRSDGSRNLRLHENSYRIFSRMKYFSRSLPLSRRRPDTDTSAT